MAAEDDETSQRNEAASKSCDRHVGHLVDDIADVISGPSFERRLASSRFLGKCSLLFVFRTLEN